MHKVFINEAFEKAINDYLQSSDKVQGVIYNSFLVVVIRLLKNLYGELDLINPYKMNDEELLKENLSKYGYSKFKVELFLSNLQLFYDIEKENQNKQIKTKNHYFITVQKDIIDMLICKKLNFDLKQSDVTDFYSLLYTPYSNNPLQVSYNFLNAEDVFEIDRYFS